MYLFHYCVKTLVVLHAEFILIFLESKMATIFFKNYLNLNYMTCVILFVKLYLFRMLR